MKTFVSIAAVWVVWLVAFARPIAPWRAEARAIVPREGGQGRGAVFPQQQRPPGDPAVIERGRSIYSVSCSACHGVDGRGGQLGGPNLLRSQLVLADKEGELIVPVIQKGRPEKGMPPMPVNEADARAIATFLHHLLSLGGRQGRPPETDAPAPDVLVGDAAAGQAYVAAKCVACHPSNLQGIGSRAPDAKTLQNLWVSGGVGGGRGRGGRGGGGRGSSGPVITATVTLPNGEKVEGPVRRYDDFIVTLIQPDGTERSFRRDGDRPKVDINDPLKGHKDLWAVLTDKDMHDVTAYLVTLK